MRNTPRRYVLVLADDHINHIWFGEAWRRWVKFWSSEFCRIQPTSDGPKIIYMTGLGAEAPVCRSHGTRK
jgi:hypothetical protein